MPDMLVKLYELPDAQSLITDLAEEKIVIRHAMPYERHLVVEWVKTNFNADWGSECNGAFSNLPVSCFIATEKSRIIGFACYECTCRNFFGPTGVDERMRGRGIGKALFLSCLHAMKAMGYGYAIIGGVGPAEFYAKTVGAVEIEDSTPGIYRDMLKE